MTTPFLPPSTGPVHHGPLQPLPPIDLVGAADARLGAVRLEPESKYVIPGERPESFIFVPIPTHDYYRVPPMVDVVPKGIHPLPPYQIVRIRSSNIDRSRLDEILHSRLEDVHISMLYGPINDASDQRYRVILLPPKSTYRRQDGTKDITIPEGQYFRVPLGAYAATPYVDICHEVADQIVRIVDARTLGHIHRLCEDRAFRLWHTLYKDNISAVCCESRVSLRTSAQAAQAA
ncbi:hypothetical protein APHAL10511_008137 [Amanita phalloides]|nr:hypothetical protein APHAL10511_008137 [Amanita phalloides]